MHLLPLNRALATPFKRRGVVIPLGLVGSTDAGRILECSVIKDGSTWKAWYSGMATNGGGRNQNWKVHYATSSDGLTWTSGGMVLTEAWEQDVVKDGSTYYMVYVTDSGYNVRIASSSDGTTWTDAGEIINSNATWASVGADVGPREPNLMRDPVSGNWYCYFSCEASEDGKYKVGIASCPSGSNPLTPGNWTVQSTPLFAPTYANKWNDGGDTESPCVRYYSSLGKYVMSFIGYRPRGTANKSWLPGLAVCDTPDGTFVEIDSNPFINADSVGSFDDNIVGEMSHLENGGTYYFYYSGGTTNGANRVGLLTISEADLRQRIFR